MRLQVFSDIHLEFAPLHLPPPEADVIVAAGDIGVGLEGVTWLKSLDRPVVYVLGNHEYWGQDFSSFVDEVREACVGSQVHLLEQDEWVHGDVRFLGCSLWTDYRQSSLDVMAQALVGMNDFRYISDGSLLLNPLRLLEVHAASREWLQARLKEGFAGRTVVVTHHAPSFLSWHRDPSDVFQYCYCSDLEGVMRSWPVALWVHGHTHETADYLCHGTRVLCNPRGYALYEEVGGFQPGQIVEL